MDIAPGTSVRVKDAYDAELERVAVTGVVMGHDFPVVWVTRANEWRAASTEGREPDSVPWPAEDVKPADGD